ncbi:N-acetylglucosamine-1-phosphate uridyltransferase [Halobacteriales archaeon QS_1_68_20]|nr:MAG: N-acetylglucosamine-1-phosphate uridyltransferase [Halobacteriales archaeon QS_1_68_20]
MRRIGGVVNPIAGMGGRVGLKGTDGKVEEARELGADQRASERAVEALARLHELAPETDLLTYGGEMGEQAAREAGFDPEVVGHSENPERTRAADTRAAVRAFAEAGVDLVLFVGGDGTAVDVTETLEELDADVPMLGVPAGVKVYSSVFAVTPREAGRVAAEFEWTERREVNDIDERAYREEGEVRTELKGIARVPVAEALQSSKQLSGGSVETLAAGVAADVEPGTTYVFGPGSTVGTIERELGFEGSPLGVDVWRAVPADTETGWRGELLVADARESEILDHLGERNVVVVSPIGGQGFVFGRGNHQISPAVIRRSDVEVVASKEKLDDVGVLRVDTDDEAVEEDLRGWTKVRVGRFERRMMKVV